MNDVSKKSRSKNLAKSNYNQLIISGVEISFSTTLEDADYQHVTRRGCKIFVRATDFQQFSFKKCLYKCLYRLLRVVTEREKELN